MRQLFIGGYSTGRPISSIYRTKSDQAESTQSWVQSTEEDYVKLKENIKLYLAAKSVTASDLSRATKVPKATISDWLSGRSPKNLQHLKLVAEYFGTTIDHLAFGSFGESSPSEHSFQESSELVPWGKFEVFMKKIK